VQLNNIRLDAQKPIQLAYKSAKSAVSDIPKEHTKGNLFQPIVESKEPATDEEPEHHLLQADGIK
jgi:hypothetical protein